MTWGERVIVFILCAALLTAYIGIVLSGLRVMGVL